MCSSVQIGRAPEQQQLFQDKLLQHPGERGGGACCTASRMCAQHVAPLQALSTSLTRQGRRSSSARCTGAAPGAGSGLEQSVSLDQARCRKYSIFSLHSYQELYTLPSQSVRRISFSLDSLHPGARCLPPGHELLSHLASFLPSPASCPEP